MLHCIDVEGDFNYLRETCVHTQKYADWSLYHIWWTSPISCKTSIEKQYHTCPWNQFNPFLSLMNFTFSISLCYGQSVFVEVAIGHFTAKLSICFHKCSFLISEHKSEGGAALAPFIPKSEFFAKTQSLQRLPRSFSKPFFSDATSIGFVQELFLVDILGFWQLGSREKGWLLKGHWDIYWGTGKTSINFWVLLLIELSDLFQSFFDDQMVSNVA